MLNQNFVSRPEYQSALPVEEAPSRRQFLLRHSAGFGFLALAGMLGQTQPLAAAEQGKREQPLAPKSPHFPPRAKRVIFCCMQGAPSHVDTFDHKPLLTRHHGRDGLYGGQLLGSPWKFQPRGESGLEISELLPNLAGQADELCLIRSMHCDQPVHPAAQTQMHTGTAQFVRPSLGAWTLYGLGTENQSIPGFVSLSPPPGNSRHYDSAFLPAVYGGTPVGRGRRGFFARNPSMASEPVPDLSSKRLSRPQQREQLDLIQTLNRDKLQRVEHHPGIEGMIQSYELAFRMQDAMPELMDLSGETEATMRMYGADGGPTAAFGQQCLMARRFVEAGVRFVQLTQGGWDHHRNLSEALPASCERIDRPIAGLLADLKQRDLLKDTLVIWGGEFGRTPAAQNGNGRDHNNKGYTTWMAGGGVRGGLSYGATDDYGYRAVQNPVHIHDWHATILHLLGLDHERLTYRYAGRDYRLTDVHGDVQTGILG